MHTFIVVISCALHTVCNFPTVTIPTQAASKQACEEKANAIAGQYANQVHISCKLKK
jgi:hypothetical protein